MSNSRRRFQASDFAHRTFDALSPWINEKCSGKWYIPNDGQPKPIYLIKQEAQELAQRWKAGEHVLRYKNGGRFFPSHLWAFLRPKHIDEMVTGHCKYYYTGGRHGRTLLMIDIDAHEPWQTDAKETMRQVVDMLSGDNCFVVESTRGYNVFVKWKYLEKEPFGIWRPNDWRAANKTILSLQSALKRSTAHRLSCVEVKGTISVSSEHYGSLAKLPCYGAWSEDRLDEFRNLPIMGENWIQDKIIQMEKIESKPGKDKPKAIMKSGSCDSFTLSQDDIDSIPRFVKTLKSRSWCCDSRKVDPKRQGVKLVPLDFTFAFIVLSFARKYRKKQFGEQMPTNFIEAIWSHLYKTGIFTRAFDTSRWSAIRNTLTDCGFLLHFNNRYWFDCRGEKKGKAMEWRLLDQYDLCFEKERGEEIIIQEVYPVHEPNRWRPFFMNPQHHHYHLIGRLELWETDDYSGGFEAMAA